MNSTKPVLQAPVTWIKALATRDNLIQLRSKPMKIPLAYPQRAIASCVLALLVSDETDSAPTEAEYQEFDKLKSKLTTTWRTGRSCKKTDLASFQKIMAGQNIQAIVVRRPKPPAQGARSLDKFCFSSSVTQMIWRMCKETQQFVVTSAMALCCVRLRRIILAAA